MDPIYVATGLEGIADQRVAAYIAKYATEAAESAGTGDRPIREVADVARLDVAVHAQRMIYTCFALANDPAYRCGSGRTCSATAAASRPRAATTRPRSARCARCAPIIKPIGLGDGAAFSR
ncbi:UNVERIFIED_ORG: hypothetical protein FHR35_005504 [Microbispora rosea subsp. rosea]